MMICKFDLCKTIQQDIFMIDHFPKSPLGLGVNDLYCVVNYKSEHILD